VDVPDTPEPPGVSEVNATSCTLTCPRPDKRGAPVTSYVLEHIHGGTSDTKSIPVSDTDLQYTFVGLTPDIKHQFRVAAVNKKGQSKFSLVSETKTGKK